MDNKYYHRGSGEVVETDGREKLLTPEAINAYIASLPVIGKIEIPDYPVRWVGDDCEMVWQVCPEKYKWVTVDEDWYYRANPDYRRILFLPKERGITITSLAGDYTKEAEELYPLHDVFSKDERDAHIKAREMSAAEIDRLRGEVERLIIDNMTHEFNQAEAEKFAPEYERQIREDEANKWREQVRKLREGLEEMISTIEQNTVGNRVMIENVKLWAKSWREELLTETEGYEQGLAK